MLRERGHDVLTSQEAGNSHTGVPDPDVLTFATKEGRAVVTLNRKDFIRLHAASPDHAGIIVCTENPDFPAMAEKIHEAIKDRQSLAGE